MFVNGDANDVFKQLYNAQFIIEYDPRSNSYAWRLNADGSTDILAYGEETAASLRDEHGTALDVVQARLSAQLCKIRNREENIKNSAPVKCKAPKLRRFNE